MEMRTQHTLQDEHVQTPDKLTMTDIRAVCFVLEKVKHFKRNIFHVFKGRGSTNVFAAQ